MRILLGQLPRPARTVAHVADFAVTNGTLAPEGCSGGIEHAFTPEERRRVSRVAIASNRI